MSYINGGVRCQAVPVATKRRLKDLVRDHPEQVWFFPTSPMGQQFEGKLTEMPEHVKLQVCGPDPYKSRKWYATISRFNDKILVS